jgi:hypothetical protein
MASIDERYYGPLDADDVVAAIDQLRGGAEVLPEKALAKRSAAGGPEPEPDPRVAEAEQAIGHPGTPGGGAEEVRG